MNLLAAANPHARFYATDFDPSQIAGARQLAAEAGPFQRILLDTSFADFASQPDLPNQFDVISLHGIYSRIGEENQRAIVDFITRKLKVGRPRVCVLQLPAGMVSCGPHAAAHVHAHQDRRGTHSASPGERPHLC